MYVAQFALKLRSCIAYDTLGDGAEQSRGFANQN